MFKHTNFIPQINYMYFCIKFLSKMAHKAVIVGASGLIGRHLINNLLLSYKYSEVVSISRKKLPIHSSKLKQVIAEFDDVEAYEKYISGHALFCCLGSTRSKTPDKNEYYTIDHDHPVRLAEMAKKSAVEQYHLVSSMGADAKSSNFYLKMKGETETDIRKVGLNALCIYRPSILVGERTESRQMERMAIKFMLLMSPLLVGPFKKYRAIHAKAVAKAMYKTSLKPREGVYIYSSEQIKRRA
jgi:uncharacterized protein YbjT (DUF2867 family)